MYDIIIFRGLVNNKINEFKVREWLNSFTGEIIDFKVNIIGEVTFLFNTVRRV